MDNSLIDFLFDFLLILLLCLYGIMVFRFGSGWKKGKSVASPLKNTHRSTTISIVVCCKNEEKQLPSLFKALSAQTDSDFELILVNDHSTDSTRDHMLKAEQLFEKVQVLNAVSFGKKASIRTGVQAAISEFVLFTDADCLPQPGWVNSVKKAIQQTNPDLIIGPVMLKNGNTLFQKLQQLEFLSLVASAMGGAMAHIPFMCNGANLTVRKQSWLESQHDLNNHLLSGDDMFLLLSVKKRKGTILALADSEAMVVTHYSETISSFFRQRNRWLSKFFAYRDIDVIGIASMVGSLNIALALSPVMCMLGYIEWTVLAVVFGIKWLVDSCFLYSTTNIFPITFSPLLTLLLSVFYPYYVLMSLLGIPMRGRNTW